MSEVHPVLYFVGFVIIAFPFLMAYWRNDLVTEAIEALITWKGVAIICTSMLCATAVWCSRILQPAEFLPVVAHDGNGWTLYRVRTHDVDSPYPFNVAQQRLTDSIEDSKIKAAKFDKP